MYQNLMKRSWERAELLLETARQRPNKIRITSTASQTKWKSIYQKLTELYVEECTKEPKLKHLRNATHLLDKLVLRDKLGCLVLNLYPGNEGYSVLLKGRTGNDTETVRLPYEESELLQYIDNEELPPVLVDILECSQVNIFYSGCVICEVRDYRRSSSPNIYESHHVLLRPSTQSIICDVNAITSDGNKWTQEDKLALESHLLLATQEPLCLEPSITVSLVANYLHHSKHKFSVPSIKNMSKRFSQAAINRKWKFERHAAPSHLKLYDFLAKRKDKKRSQAFNLKTVSPGADTAGLKEANLVPPTHVEVDNYAQILPQLDISRENNLDFVEEYTLESKQNNGKGYFCRMTIYLRTLDNVFIGELYTDRDYVEGQMKGATCRFDLLGSKVNVDRYINQFIEIFTQECRKTVKISHEVKGQGVTMTTIPGGHPITFPISKLSPVVTANQSCSPTSKRPAVNKTVSSPGPGSTNPITSPTHAPSPSHVSSATGSQGAATGTSSIASIASGRPNSRLASSNSNTQRPPSRPSSVSPGPVVVMSPAASGHCVTQLTALQAQTHVAKGAATPPPNSRTPPTPNPSLGVRLPSGLTGGHGDSTGILTPVSLTGMTVPTGIAVPISLMATANTSGVILSSIPNLVPQGSVGPGPPSSPSAQAGTTSVVPSTALMVTAGMPSVPSAVVTLGPPPRMAQSTALSFPMGISPALANSNLAARFIASNLKGSPHVGIQPNVATNPLGFLQITGAANPNAVSSVFSTGSGPRAKGSTPPSGSTPPPPVSASGISVSSTLMAINPQQQLTLQQNQQQIASLQLQQLRQQPSSSSPTSQVAPSTAKSKGRKKGGTTPPK